MNGVARALPSPEKGTGRLLTTTVESTNLGPSRTGSETIALVIPTRNASLSLSRLGRSIRAQSRPPDQVIVVDSSEADSTAATGSSFGFKVIRARVDRVRARKVALDSVHEDRVAFIDSDQVLAPECLEQYFRATHGREDVAVVPLELSETAGRWGELLRAQDRTEFGLGEGLPRFFSTSVLRSIPWDEVMEHSLGHGEDRFLRNALERAHIGILNVESVRLFHQDPPIAAFFRKQFENTRRGTAPGFGKVFVPIAAMSFARLSNPVSVNRILKSPLVTTSYLIFLWLRMVVQVAGLLARHLAGRPPDL